MAKSKSVPTLAELNVQIAALQSQADVMRKKEMVEVIAKVKDAIQHYGLTADDLGLGKTAPNKSSTFPTGFGKKVAKKTRNGTAKPAAKKVKFKDDQGHTWGGMGKRPDWFKAALASGKTPEELLAKG
jgi:DNA-binding protein H-NS